MNLVLLKALFASVPARMLLFGAVAWFLHEKNAYCFLQLLGAGCPVVVVLARVSEALHLFPWMHWGAEHGAGDYLDLSSVILGLALFPPGYLLHSLAKRHA